MRNKNNHSLVKKMLANLFHAQVPMSLIVIMDIPSTPSQVSPRCLQETLRINGGGGGERDDILSNVSIYPATL